jgi:hypothetical protein
MTYLDGDKNLGAGYEHRAQRQEPALEERMSLRVSDDNRPGYAILDFGRDIGADDLLISLQSKLFNPGEYLGLGGKWSKAPHLFKAIHLPSAGPGIYRIGPEIVNQQDLAHDTIEVSVSGGGFVEEVMWPELTPAALLSEPDTTIYREPELPPPQAPLRPASRPPADLPLPLIEEQALAKEEAEKKVSKTPAWLKFGVPAGALLFLLVMLSSWLLCSPFDFMCRLPDAFGPAVACAKSESPSEPCSAAQCFESFLATNPLGEQRLKAESMKKTYDLQCVRTFQDAKSCGERNRQGDPCVAQQCYDEFLKDRQAPRENRAEAERLAAGFKLQCETKKKDDADRQAAAQAEACIAEHRRPPCNSSENCLASYIASSPSGAERERLSRLARETFDECEGEAISIERAKAAQHKDDEAFELAKGCAAHAECGKKRACYDLYRNGFPNGTHLGEVERTIAGDRCTTAVALPEGIYNGRASREDSCAAEAASVQVTIKDGKICWEHKTAFENKWEGSVGPDGVVEAKTRGRNATHAAGRVVNGGSMSIEMTYPECQNPIRMQLSGMISGSPAPCR